MGGKSSQRKGRSGELEIVKIFQAHGIDAQPGQAVSFGNTPDVVNIPHIHPEVKRVERLNVSEAMTQAVRDSEKFHDGTPVLFHRRNRQEWLCTMRLEDWMSLYLAVERAKTDDSGKGVLNVTQQRACACGPPDPRHEEGGGSGSEH